MKAAILAAIVALSLCGTASAETFEFPSEEPVVSVTYPDTWTAEETDIGTQGFSAGNEVAFYLSLSAPGDMSDNVEKAATFLLENGVTIDEKSNKQSEAVIDGIPVKFNNFDGADENGPVTIGLYFLEVSPETTVIVTNWATADAIDETIGKEMESILTSIKAVK